MSDDNLQGDAHDAALASTEPLACVSCRSRKLKCDRTRPSCTRCVKVSNECVYPESRRKPTMKRRNVKELEARLAQVEDYLKEANKGGSDGNDDAAIPTIPRNDADLNLDDFNFEGDLADQDSGTRDGSNLPQQSFDMPRFANQGESLFGDGQLLGLGLSESLPPFEVMEDLNNTFFTIHYNYIPVVHSGRYYQAFYGPPMKKPPMCLQYAIWAMAAVGHPKYDFFTDAFYKRARKYADADEMSGEGENFITLGHAQTWAILGSYEAKNMLFTRAAMSCAKCVRLVQMMGLDRLDGGSNELPPTLSPTSSWIELEERRKVFWGAFAIDSHASIATGWPNLINSSEILTRLPASEEAFASGREEKTAFLEEVFTGAPYADFSGVIIICQIFKTILQHIHRYKPNDKPEDLDNGSFWNRHRDIDNKLSSTFMFLPTKFRLPQNLRDPPAVHTNLNLHASAICLHHAALEMIDKHSLPESAKHTSLCRLRSSAEEIVNIVKMTSHSPAVFKSPLCAVSMYCATTVYVYAAKKDPATPLNAADTGNLQILVHAMEAVARIHKMTLRFLQQACLDIERNGLSSTIRLPGLDQYRDIGGGQFSNIPLLVRNSITRHTQTSSVLPGKLPLDNPLGNIRQSNFKTGEDNLDRGPLGTESLVQELINGTCFQSITGAAMRNMAHKPAENVPNKRKRMSASPGPDAGMNRNIFGAVVGEVSDGGFSEPTMREGGGLSSNLPRGKWGYGGLDLRPQMVDVAFSLPDRTNSSVSSPANRGTGTETMSGSSGTSPGIGLGNTPEDNYVDLRFLQDRIATPIWQNTEDALFAQITSTIDSSCLPTDGNDPWGIMNANLSWSNDAATE